jgi:hypothetical protein
MSAAPGPIRHARSTPHVSLLITVIVTLIGSLIVVGSAACSGGRLARTDQAEVITFSRIDRAWALSTGSGVRVAVIDWQFDMRPAAAARLVDPTSLVPDEKIGALKPWHGAWMVALVRAVAPDALIIPINAKGLAHRGFQDTLVLGIRYAADHGAVAVSSSMGPARQTPALRAAIDYAEERGTVFVNVHPEIVETAGEPDRPCAIGECDSRIVHAGPVSVPAHEVTPDPARDVYTWPYDLEAVYEDGWGYSNAPPVVVGVIALMKSANPTLTPGQIRELLAQTAFIREGFRVLDGEAAVRRALALMDPDNPR